ncbi:SIS domain-containing protein [Patescibacteria group bacterium]
MNIDKSNVRGVILSEFIQFEKGFEFTGDTNSGSKFKTITISGMGGSALPADALDVFIRDLIKRKKAKSDLMVYLNRFYKLPNEAYDESLNVICSFSGNTEESISALNEAIENKLPTVGVSAGGKLEEICLKNKIAHIKIKNLEENFQPRMATGYFFAIILKLLINEGMIDDITKEIVDESVEFEAEIAEMEETGERIAKRIVGKTPVIYSTDKFRSLAMIWKIKINENAKTPAFWNYFPELNHNEMVGFTNPQSKFFFVMIRDLDDNPQNIKRFEVMANLMNEKGMEVEIVDLKDGSVFAKLFEALYLGDWVSYYLALEYKQDPNPVDMVEDFKSMIG